jgi:uncharacterized protein with FMN-binding domain
MQRVVLAVTTTIAGLVMLLSFKTHPTTASAAGSQAPITATSAKATAAAGGSTGTASTASARSTTVTGAVSQTQYGPVQVRVTVRKGAVTAVSAVQYPSGDANSQQINAYAIPLLDREALAAGNASINMISGATYTSNGYLASLQSALTKAGVV